jgi:cytochrome P450
LITLLIAGHETTATALTWALLHLAQHRPALERLRFDVEDVGAPEDVARRPYLSAVVDETLRIRPVVPVVSRKTSRALSIAGMGLPEGAMIAPCIYLAHRRAARFPEPEAFRPERFIGQEYSPFEYLPFGGGVRRCLGYGLALFEMKLVLAELVQRFDFEIAERAVGRPVRRTIIVAPSGGVRMVLRRRESAVA